jgi:hypothetical protein
MRAVFQAQPDVSHVYLGSKRSLMAELFTNANEPFWRSAKHIELGRLPLDAFAAFIAERFEATGKHVPAGVVDGVLAITRGHPYGTQELCYALWEETPADGGATKVALDGALAHVLRSENRTSHMSGMARRARNGSSSRRSRPTLQTPRRARTIAGDTGCRRRRASNGRSTRSSPTSS